MCRPCTIALSRSWLAESHICSHPAAYTEREDRHHLPSPINTPLQPADMRNDAGSCTARSLFSIAFFGTPQRQVVASQNVYGKRIPSDEQYRPYSVGVATRPSTRELPDTHTPPGSPEHDFISSSRSPYAPRLSEALALPDDFELQRKLGESSEGKVYLGKHKRNGEVVALKVLHRSAKTPEIADLPEDCLLHLHLIPFHRHIVFMSQIDIAKLQIPRSGNSKVWQCLSFCNAGDLEDYQQRVRGYDLQEPGQLIFALHVFIQLSEALAFLHYGLSRDPISGEWSVDTNFPGPILHSDVKPENVMLHFHETNDLGMPDVRLGDFGQATVARFPHPVAGSPDYFSPEAKNHEEGLKGPPMQMASDVYTFGLTLYNLITRTRWAPAKHPGSLTLPPEYEAMGFIRVLQECLKLNPRLRPTMDHHPVSGLLHCVDYACKERAQLNSSSGHVGSFFWKNWRRDAVNAGRGT